MFNEKRVWGWKRRILDICSDGKIWHPGHIGNPLIHTTREFGYSIKWIILIARERGDIGKRNILINRELGYIEKQTVLIISELGNTSTWSPWNVEMLENKPRRPVE